MIMKTNLFKKISLLAFILAFVALVGVSADWSDPVNNAPQENLAIPIHEGNNQVKNGGLGVNNFTAYQSAAFLQDSMLYGILRGGALADINSTVFFGGTGADGATTYNVDLSVNGKLSAAGTLTQDDVANADASHLCADNIGKIVVCGPDNDDGGSNDCGAGTAHAWPDGNCHPTVTISSPYPGMTITSVSGIPGFTYDAAHPVGNTYAGYQSVQEGVHDFFSGQVSFTIGGPTQFDGNATIYKNGDRIKCVNMLKGSSSTTVTTITVPFSTEEVIRISGDSGLCS